MFEKVVRRGTLLTVIVLIVSVMGILAAFRVPVQMIPDLEVRAITVETRWPGATPQDVEKEILIEQEDYLRTIPNLQRITATASSGRAQIELEFPFGIDITETLIRVSNALTQVPSYPLNVDEPRIYATSFSSNSFMFFHIAPLPGNPRGLDMDLMRDFLVDNVRTRMSSVAGVSEINIGGGAERQIQILLDQVRMAERGLSVVQVRDAVRNRNRDISAGEVNSGKRRYLLRTVGRFADIEALGSTILARRGDSVIRLEDVATVRMDHSEITRLSWVNGEPSIMVSVRREAGSNVIAIKEALLQEVAVLNREVLEPAGMHMSLTADDVGYVQASLTNVWINLGLGAVLASGILLLFLGSVPPTAIGAMGIPICTIAAFLGLLLAGRTINVISLAGVAFAIGMTLDNSIVVLESIELARRRGLERFEAAVTGVRQVWPAVLASTSTTILVFLPVLFVVQEAGQLYSDVAIAISASILASMLVAIMVVPTASARLPFNQPNGATSVHPLRERILSVVSKLIATPVNRLATIGVTAAISIVVIAGLMPPAEYLPEGEEPKVFARVSAPPGYNLSTMLEIAEEMQESLVPRVNADMASFNRNPNTVPPLKYVNMWATAEGLTIISQPVDAGHIHLLMEALDRLFEAYPGIRSFSSRGSIITSNSGGTRSVTLDIAGPRLEVIYEVASHVYERAQQVLDGPRIQTNPRTLSLAQPLVEVRPDWERAAELGLDAGGLGFTVAALTNGAFVDEFFLDDDKIDIYLYSGAGTSASLDDLESVLVYVPTVGAIPLSSLASVVETADTSSIRRVNGRRTVTLNIIPPRDVALETGVEIVRRDVIRHLRDAGAIPADVASNHIWCRRSTGCHPGSTVGELRRRISHCVSVARCDLHALGLPIVDHGDHTPGHCRRLRGIVASQCSWICVTRSGVREDFATVRYDLHAGFPDTHGYSGQQPHSHRASGSRQRTRRPLGHSRCARSSGGSAETHSYVDADNVFRPRAARAYSGRGYRALSRSGRDRDVRHTRFSGGGADIAAGTHRTGARVAPNRLVPQVEIRFYLGPAARCTGPVAGTESLRQAVGKPVYSPPLLRADPQKAQNGRQRQS